MDKKGSVSPHLNLSWPTQFPHMSTMLLTPTAWLRVFRRGAAGAGESWGLILGVSEREDCTARLGCVPFTAGEGFMSGGLAVAI